MALPPLADVDMLAAWVGQDVLDPRRAEAVLSAASAVVRAEAGQTWTDDAGAPLEVPDDVAAVVVQVAARVWHNPAGLQSVTVDDATRRWSDSGGAGLYLTDGERAILARYREAGAPSGLGVLSTTRGEETLDTLYVPTEPPGEPFPWYDAREFPA